MQKLRMSCIVGVSRAFAAPLTQKSAWADLLSSEEHAMTRYTFGLRFATRSPVASLLFQQASLYLPHNVHGCAHGKCIDHAGANPAQSSRRQQHSGAPLAVFDCDGTVIQETPARRCFTTSSSTSSFAYHRQQSGQTTLVGTSCRASMNTSHCRCR